MKKKILRVILNIVGILIILVCGLLITQMFFMQKTLVNGSQKAGDAIESLSGQAMRDQARYYLTEAASTRAWVSDGEFSKFAGSIRMIADATEDIYAHPERYGDDTMGEFDDSDLGSLVVYTAYGDGTDPDDALITHESRLLANLQGVLMAVNRYNEEMSADYFASESGIFVCAEAASVYNLKPEDGPRLFEARQRPWYEEARDKEDAVFTGMITDADTGEYVITCGVPVSHDGKFMGVAGGGMFLDSIRADVDGFKVGENGYACILNSHGQILFSGAKDGALAATEDNLTDIRNSVNTELAGLAEDALEGHTSIRVVMLGMQRYYVAYAPMETVGWAYLTVLPEDEVLKPTRALIDELDGSNAEQNEFVRESVLSSVKVIVLIFALIGGIMALIAAKFADRLAAPVVKLTDCVSSIEGDNLDFNWDIDTRDEVQTLAVSFESMTVRMKQYIKDITEITAEKERIGVELSVAKHIQAAMLPSIFPPFPERNEFELYATMDPAKEVGGDFYDFFLTDDDHIALVIADVSGKGIPAALFMMIAKIIIKNHVRSGRSPEEALRLTGNQLCEGNTEGMFVTAWIGIVDLETGHMVWSDAGHEIPYIVHNDGTLEQIKPPKKKPPVATVENIDYRAYESDLACGDTLFLYTDGVPEASDSSDSLYGITRLERVLASSYTCSPEELLKNVRDDVDRFVGDASQFDDLTMLGIRFRGKNTPRED